MRRTVLLLTLFVVTTPAMAQERVRLRWNLDEGDVYKFRLRSTIVKREHNEAGVNGQIEIKDLDDSGRWASATMTFSMIFYKENLRSVGTDIAKGDLQDIELPCKLYRTGKLRINDDELASIEKKLSATYEGLDLAPHLEGMFLELPDYRIRVGNTWLTFKDGSAFEFRLDKITRRLGQLDATLRGRTKAVVPLAPGEVLSGSIEVEVDISEGYITDITQKHLRTRVVNRRLSKYRTESFERQLSIERVDKDSD